MADVELTGSVARELASMTTAINELQQVIARAERAGLDVAEMKRQLAVADAKRQGLLREFAPGMTQRKGR